MPRRGKRKASETKTSEEGKEKAVEEPVTKKGRGLPPTVQEIVKDPITQLAKKYWAPGQQKLSPYDAKVIEKIYENELSNLRYDRVMMLEFSGYLENYLWTNFDPKTSTFAHLMSIVAMVNEKFREGVNAFVCFHEKEDLFSPFLHKVLDLWNGEKEFSPLEKQSFILFLVNCFRSLEDSMVRKQMLRLVSLPLWWSLGPLHRQLELEKVPQIQRHWRALKKRESKLKADADGKGKKATEAKERLRNDLREHRFMVDVIADFLKNVDEYTPTHASDEKEEEKDSTSPFILYLERGVELFIDLLSEIPTRRFLRAVVEDSHMVIRCVISPLYSHFEGKRFKELVKMLKYYAKHPSHKPPNSNDQEFQIDDHTGEALNDAQMEAVHAAKIQSLQRIAFQQFSSELRGVAMSHIGGLETRSGLLNHFSPLSFIKVRNVCEAVGIIGPVHSTDMNGGISDNGMNWGIIESKSYLLELLVYRYEKRIALSEMIKQMPLYQNEEGLWDQNILPLDQYYHGDHGLPLPKLNLQFLTIRDYLHRNFTLYRLESSYEIREDIQDAVQRLNPSKEAYSEKTIFNGWARMAIPVQKFEIKKVSRPLLGEVKPAEVLAEVTYTLKGMQGKHRAEWGTDFRLHDSLFLLSIQSTRTQNESANQTQPFHIHYGIRAVRGAEVRDIMDGFGTVFEENALDPSKSTILKGDQRTLRVLMDTAQYQADMDNSLNVYDSFNILIRRKAKENNFKAVLETIRDLMDQPTSVPSWLRDIFLGYGDPSSVFSMKGLNAIDFRDSFLDFDHVKASFPDKNVVLAGGVSDEPRPPYLVEFERRATTGEQSEYDTVIVKPYHLPYPGPYPFNKPKRNKIRFTSAQINAIKHGVQSGITMVVGPPGTGKTDVAVQIIQTLYHNFPKQRTLLVTHSNQALNQLFEKIMELDIDERHLLRLGHGEEMLETEKDFSKWGRINYMLARRIELLKEVGRLAHSLNVTHYDVSQSCETAEHFFRHHVLAKWELFSKDVSHVVNADGEKGLPSEKEEGGNWIVNNFPFIRFFDNAPQPIFPVNAVADVQADIAGGCWRHIDRIFDELREMRAFELLKSGYDRTNYMLVKQARVIAMTCTHAAITRRRLLEIGFKYDNIVMEEAAQILEVETFIPMMLQTSQDGNNRLQRVVLIGDHHQLPPVVKNMAFQKYGHLEQSLFTRFVRLGVPHILLDAQGRSRPAIATLYNWRYKQLGDLPFIHEKEEYGLTNPGFAHEFQFIDVGELRGKGEVEPTPHFFQNLAEAEYIVSVYMYMRLLGYPANKISILTTYNGQKHLLRDVVARRCRDAMFGYPKKITTVDRYQGQENDYILLSLVRTKSVGHIRDVRRLIVAMSRGRLGLYVFGRFSLFANCFELTPAFRVFKERPTSLELALGEVFSKKRKLEEKCTPFTVTDVLHMSAIVNTMFQQRLQSFYVEQTRLAHEEYLAQKEREASADVDGKEEMLKEAQARAVMQVNSEEKEESDDEFEDPTQV